MTDYADKDRGRSGGLGVEVGNTNHHMNPFDGFDIELKVKLSKQKTIWRRR